MSSSHGSQERVPAENHQRNCRQQLHRLRQRSGPGPSQPSSPRPTIRQHLFAGAPFPEARQHHQRISADDQLVQNGSMMPQQPGPPLPLAKVSTMATGKPTTRQITVTGVGRPRTLGEEIDRYSHSVARLLIQRADQVDLGQYPALRPDLAPDDRHGHGREHHGALASRPPATAKKLLLLAPVLLSGHYTPASFPVKSALARIEGLLGRAAAMLIQPHIRGQEKISHRENNGLFCSVYRHQRLWLLRLR